MVEIQQGELSFCFTLADDSIFAFAGIWDRWKNPERAIVETCSIITTSANALLSDIHDRMPVILKGEDHDRWLDPGFKQVDDILDLLKPYRADSMRRYCVSSGSTQSRTMMPLAPRNMSWRRCFSHSWLEPRTRGELAGSSVPTSRGNVQEGDQSGRQYAKNRPELCCATTGGFYPLSLPPHCKGFSGFRWHIEP